jgi:hypothetical protein
MKKITILSSLLILVTAVTRAQQPDTSFQRFAARHDSLEMRAYYQKDVPEYTHIFQELLIRYRTLDVKQRSYFSGFSAGGWYNLACTYALTGQPQKALDCLDSAITAGWTDYGHTIVDADLAGLHDDPRFSRMLQPLKETRDYLYIIGKAGKYNPDDNRPLPAWTYQSATDTNLVALRKSLRLDSIAGGGDDVTRVLHLMHWMHDAVRHDGSKGNPAVKNALSMITVCRRDHGTLNCRGLAIALNECLLSLGYRSRYVTCLPKDSLGIDQDCHVIDMVFIPSQKKWIWVDPTFDAYVMNEKGAVLGLEEVRRRIIDHRPLILNPDANWNHRNGESREDYLYNYMAKNLYRLECPANSCYDLETHAPGKDVSYIELLPLDYFKQTPDKDVFNGGDNTHSNIYKTNNSAAFWATP